MDARSKWMCPLQSPNCLTFFFFLISKIENKTFVFRRNGNRSIGRTPIIFPYKWANCDKIYKMSLTQSIINEDPINNNNNKWRYNIYIYIYIYVYVYLYIYLFILRIKVSWKMDYYELSSYNNNLITIKLEINNFM